MKVYLKKLCPISTVQVYFGSGTLRDKSIFLVAHTGCQEIADEFRSQEIDGQALLLLKEDHLMSTMNIKLGPALKIFARINMLKDS